MHGAKGRRGLLLGAKGRAVTEGNIASYLKLLRITMAGLPFKILYIKRTEEAENRTINHTRMRANPYLGDGTKKKTTAP